MGYKRVRVRVEFEDFETSEAEKVEPTKAADGCFEIDLDEAFDIDIDANEQAVLAVTYPAIRDALACELADKGKKKS